MGGRGEDSGNKSLEEQRGFLGKEVKHSGGTPSQCTSTLAESIHHFQIFLVSHSCLFPCQLLLLPLICLCCLQPCLRSHFPAFLVSQHVPFCRIWLCGALGCLPWPCLHPGLFQRNPPRRLCDSFPQAHLLLSLETRWKNKNCSSQRCPPALAVSGIGFYTLNHGSISPPPEQTASK